MGDADQAGGEGVVSDVMAMLIACADAQASSMDFHHVKLLPCTTCGEPTVELFRSGPVVCATWRIRAQVAE